MAKNQDTLFRQWHMLRLVPRHPSKITVQDVRRSLEREGFTITERSVQRDLNDLSDIFPLYCDDREKPYGWSWDRDAASFDLPGLTTPEALALAMAEQYLRDLLPLPMIDLLKPEFRAARKALDAQPQPHRGRSWLDKVRAVPPTQPLVPPKVAPGVQETISDALLRERQVNIRYQHRGEKKAAEWRIHPLALIQRGPVLYLWCRIFDYDDPRMLPIHRITSAELLDDPVQYPPGFSIDTLVTNGATDFGTGERIMVELVFDPGYGDHLLETPLGKDQEVEPLADESLRVSATVADTPQLRWWLLGFGEGVEVVAPVALRKSMAATAQAMARIYA
jgi:predicted DNA-binding transcriptional regulator YafY